MLAQVFRGIEPSPPFYIQRKYNGLRALSTSTSKNAAASTGADILIYGRRGIPFVGFETLRGEIAHIEHFWGAGALGSSNHH